MAEQLTLNQRVRGSSPWRITEREATATGGLSFICVTFREGVKQIGQVEPACDPFPEGANPPPGAVHQIDNPGGLYGEVSPENFPHAVDYRNPIIAEATRVLGYTNRFGQGIARASKALELNGNPPPAFSFDPHWFAVKIGGREAAA